MATRRSTSVQAASAATHIFLQRLETIDNLAELERAFGELVAKLGFSAFVLGQAPYVGHARTNFRITNYPLPWVKTVYANFRYGDDPALDAMNDADAPFLWEDLPAWRRPNLRQAEYIATSAQYGFSRGYSLPIRVAGEPVGAVSVATMLNGPVPIDMLPFIDHVGLRSYKRARVIVAAESDAIDGQPDEFHLTSLEMVCLRLIAQGKNDFLIAKLAGIDEAEVGPLIDSAQSKLGMRSKMSMVIRALELGYVTFNDALIG